VRKRVIPRRSSPSTSTVQPARPSSIRCRPLWTRRRPLPHRCAGNLPYAVVLDQRAVCVVALVRRGIRNNCSGARSMKCTGIPESHRPARARTPRPAPSRLAHTLISSSGYG
jgi:hypothetical protein